MQRGLLLALVLMFAMLFSISAQAQDKSTYDTLKKTQHSETVGKVEVLEFFAYTCPHCKTMEPLVDKWSETMPEDSALVRVPVAFNDNLTNLQKLYYTLESLDRLDLHSAVFNALHNDRKSLFTAEEITKWAVDQGIDEQSFSDIFNSFGINTRVNRANELVKNYDISATPTLAIGGKYITSPSHANGYQQAITVAEQLLEKARDKGQP